MSTPVERLAELDVLVTERGSIAAHELLGALVVLVSDEQWAQAVASVSRPADVEDAEWDKAIR